MIDWTKDIETIEDTPRPVRVLFDKDGRPEAAHINDNHTSPSFNLFAIEHIGAGVNATRGMYSIPLRNVPPPKPEPVLREAWVVWRQNGYFWSCEMVEAAAQEEARRAMGVYARAAVMSDGSPVEEDPLRYGVCETCVEKSVKSADEWRARAKAAEADRDEAREQRDAMRPVVDAAAELFADPNWLQWLLFDNLRSSVRTYEAKMKELAP